MRRSLSSLLTRSIGPEAYGLAISVPLTASEFLDDYEASRHSSRGDFAAQQVLQHPDRKPKEIAAWYQEHANSITEACEVGESFGIKVVQRATSSDLAQLFRERQIVIFITHLRLPQITEQDCLSPANILNTLRHPSGPLQLLLRKAVDRTLNQISLSAGKLNDESLRHAAFILRTALESLSIVPTELAKSLAKILNYTHLSAFGRSSTRSNANQDPATTVEQSETPRIEYISVIRRVHRITIERALGEDFRKGPCIEFHDGMKDVDALINAIPACTNDPIRPEDERILDMTLCNSIMLTEPIASERRHCRLRAGRYPATPIFAGLFCELLFRKIAEEQENRGISYAEASRFARSELKKFGEDE